MSETMPAGYDAWRTSGPDEVDEIDEDDRPEPFDTWDEYQAYWDDDPNPYHGDDTADMGFLADGPDIEF